MVYYSTPVYINVFSRCWGHLVEQLAEALRYKSEGRGFDSRCHCYFSLTSFRPHYGPVVDSASNRNEYQEHFLGVKAAGAHGWQSYHLRIPIVLKSGSLRLLETLGHVQAYTGIALPFLYLIKVLCPVSRPIRTLDCVLLNVWGGFTYPFETCSLSEHDLR